MSSLNAQANVKIKVAFLSVFSNTTLVCGKLAVGIWIGSASIISEAIHSATDLLASFIAFFAVGQSSRPADQEHPYGHGKFENISGAIEAGLVIVAGIAIIYEAIEHLRAGKTATLILPGIIIMGLSMVINTFVAWRLHKVAVQEDSPALAADAQHLTSDILTSFAVLLGLGLTAITHIVWIDAVTAILIALFVIYQGAKLAWQTIKGLTDTALSEDDLQVIRQILQSNDQVQSFHRLRTRKAGGEIQIDVHLQVDGQMPVSRAHAICDEIELKIKSKYPHSVTVLHVEPSKN
ncbi:MAG: cation transporter [Bacteriovoracaceae bacterium]|nr:cation transporter [Bacteriovoracaceae bacterium]